MINCLQTGHRIILSAVTHTCMHARMRTCMHRKGERERACTFHHTQSLRAVRWWEILWRREQKDYSHIMSSVTSHNIFCKVDNFEWFLLLLMIIYLTVISLYFQNARDVAILCVEYLCAVCVHDCAPSDSGIYCALWKSPKMDGKSAATNAQTCLS